MTKPWSVLPAAFQERLHELYPHQAEELLEIFCQTRPTTLRVNTLKTEPGELKQALAKDGFELESVTWLPGAFFLRSRTLRELTEHPLYLAGHLYVQSLSSMIPPLVLDPQPGESILDVAAAPGSKTTQMAALMKNQGMILANDTSLVRLYKLQANVQMQGVELVQTRRGPGQEVWQQFPEVFDRSLVDVPCSMEGRFRCDKPKTWENWSPKKIKELSLRQRALLRSAVSATKPGGVIVYSTCTLSAEENEVVIDWLLKKEQGRVVVEEMQLPGAPLTEALTGWKHQVFPQSIALTKRILPSAEVEGFYVAKLRKLSSTLVNQS